MVFPKEIREKMTVLFLMSPGQIALIAEDWAGSYPGAFDSGDELDSGRGGSLEGAAPHFQLYPWGHHESPPLAGKSSGFFN